MDFESLHLILKNLYDDMMPLCENMAALGKGLGGLGGLFYIAYRVWQSLARAEPIDVFPLLRPFALGICIMFFPTIVIGSMNTILSPIVKGTNQMLETETFDMNEFMQKRDELERKAILNDPTRRFLIDDEEYDRQLDRLGTFDIAEKFNLFGERKAYQLKKWVQNAIKDILEIIFQAVSLIIDVLRTFFLIVLTILGPIAFGISVWDGFQSNLTQWFSRYISIYLWLPVSDLFGCIIARIQNIMLKQEILQFETGEITSIDGSIAVYIIFMLIAILGYLTVPTVAGWIVQSSGGNNYSRVVNVAAIKTAGVAGGLAGSAAGWASGKAKQGGMYAGKQAIKGGTYAGSKALQGGMYAGRQAVRGGMYAGRQAIEGGKYLGDKAVEAGKKLYKKFRKNK